MKKALALVLALILLLAAAGCSASGGTDQPVNTPAENAGEPGGTKPADTAQEPQPGTPAAPAQPAVENTPPADKFLYRTTDEMRAFMQPYHPSEEIDWHEPYLRGWSQNGSIEGALMPDKMNFEHVSFGCPYNADVAQARESLLAAYQEVCEKTGLVFPGMEEYINSLDSLENISGGSYADGDYCLRIYSNGPSLELSRINYDYGTVPYTADDARAYMQNLGGTVHPYFRSVDGPDRFLWEENGEYPFGWNARLDQDDRLIEIITEYYGSDAEEGKAFFRAFTEFFATDDVREEGLRIISDSYDSLEEGTYETISLDRLYQVTLFREVWGYRMNINISNNARIPDDAPAFPNAEEQAALALDPFTRMGVNPDVSFPETVIFEQGTARIVLEKVKCVYAGTLMFRISIRMENIPDGIAVDVDIKEINGQSIDDYWQISYSSAGTFLSYKEPHDPVERGTIQLYIAELVEAYGLKQLDSLTFKGAFREYVEDEEHGPEVINTVYFDDVVCKAEGR